MEKGDLLNLLRFTEFTNIFATVQRKTITNKDGTLENNAQHSFQMAIIAWYINDANKLGLNIEKIVSYALVHDLVETYSGNYPAYSRDAANQKTKDTSEKEALEQIKREFKAFPELIKSLDGYYAMKDEESSLIYALDKFLPLLNIELNNNDFYFKTKTTREEMLKVKKDKIAKNQTIEAYFNLLLDYFSSDVKFFWPECADRDYSEKVYFS